MYKEVRTMKIDWIRTIRNFVLFVVLTYTVASVYFITTNRTEFNEYKEYNTKRELLKDADIVDVFLVAFDANSEDVNKRKRNAKIASVKSYVTFAIDCIKENK